MRIAFVHNGLATFVERDLRILREKHEVREVYYRGLLSLPKLLSAVLWCNLSFTWFAAVHGLFTVLLSMILGKKAVVVSGGYEVVCVPEIKYGLCYRWWKRWCPKLVFRLADLILCVSKCNLHETLTNASAPRNKTQLIYNAVETDQFPLEDSRKRAGVITIASILGATYKKKGLHLFTESAKYLPQVSFFLVGPAIDSTGEKLEKLAPANVVFTGPKYGKQLVSMLQKSKVYVQASAHESFGVAVIEAMLCGCVPVVSRRGALPEVVGDCGFYLDDLTPEELAAKIRIALGSNPGPEARRWVARNFSFKKRERELLAAIDQIGSRHGT